MGRGLSKLQRTILGLLDGSVKRQVYRGGGGLDTPELLEELIAAEVIPDPPNRTKRQYAMFTVRRACTSLLRRGLLEGHYDIHCDYPWAEVLNWEIKKR